MASRLEKWYWVAGIASAIVAIAAFFHARSGNTGPAVSQVAGSGNTHIANNQGTILIRQREERASSHPITTDMGLKWTPDDFAETVRSGNLPAIKEYLNANDGFDTNSLDNGNIFVLELPIFEGTKNFPDILQLFKQTGNWTGSQLMSGLSGVGFTVMRSRCSIRRFNRRLTSIGLSI